MNTEPRMRHTENADDPNAGGPAFPIKGPLMSSDVLGMTLRDYFAAKAMHAYWSDPNVDGDPNIAAIWAYKVADAMLQARVAPFMSMKPSARTASENRHD